MDTAPGDDIVCYSMIKNAPLAAIDTSSTDSSTSHSQTIPIPKKDKTHHPISLLPAFSKVMERLVQARVKWSAQPINPYSLGFRSGVGKIDSIATLIHTAPPITAIRRRYNSPIRYIWKSPWIEH